MLAVHSYYHTGADLDQYPAGVKFGWDQISLNWLLFCCLHCRAPVISGMVISLICLYKINRKLKDTGFIKLMWVNDGFFENVICRSSDEKYVDCCHLKNSLDLNRTVKD